MFMMQGVCDARINGKTDNRYVEIKNFYARSVNGKTIYVTLIREREREREREKAEFR
jgi:hypothetical protein